MHVFCVSDAQENVMTHKLFTTASQRTQDLTALAYTYEITLVRFVTKYSLPLRDPIVIECPITSA